MPGDDYQLPLTHRLFSATLGSVAVAFLMTPLDVTKVRMQAQRSHDLLKIRSHQTHSSLNWNDDHLCNKVNCNHSTTLQRTRNPLQMAAYLIRHEGILTLWSGLRPTLVMSIPGNVLYFGAYDYLKSQLDKHLNAPHMSPFLSGSCARLVAATSVSPIELVRTQMQSNAKIDQIGFARRFRVILSSPKGTLAIFKGLSPTLMRDIPFSGIYWTMYENTTQLIAARGWKDYPKPYLSFVSGAIAGTTAALLTTPFDVAKTHKQTYQVSDVLKENVKLNTFQILMKLWRNEGLPGLFAGNVSLFQNILFII
jgi:solute carrier family 25, member 39/40